MAWVRELTASGREVSDDDFLYLRTSGQEQRSDGGQLSVAVAGRVEGERTDPTELEGWTDDFDAFQYAFTASSFSFACRRHSASLVINKQDNNGKRL
jgi:hypothetical protein